MVTQPDLFGGPAAEPAYVVPYLIAVNTLTKRWPCYRLRPAGRGMRT